MYRAEEKQQLEQLRKDFTCRPNMQVQAVKGGYIVTVVENYIDDNATIMATVQHQTVCADEYSIMQAVYETYGRLAMVPPPPPYEEPPAPRQPQ